MITSHCWLLKSSRHILLVYIIKTRVKKYSVTITTKVCKVNVYFSMLIQDKPWTLDWPKLIGQIFIFMFLQHIPSNIVIHHKRNLCEKFQLKKFLMLTRQLKLYFVVMKLAKVFSDKLLSWKLSWIVSYQD